MLAAIPLAYINVFSSAYSQSDLFGKLIFLTLFLLSAICWIVLMQKVYLVKKVKKAFKTFESAFAKRKEHVLQIELEELITGEFRQGPNPLAELFLSLKEKAIELLNKNLFFLSQQKKENDHPPLVYLSQNDLELLESHVLTTASKQAKLLEKNLFILSTVMALAPFLGLLGTVWGILITFSELQHGGSAGSNSIILGGLSTALVTTVLGLLIAIPALIAYNYLKNCSRTLSSDMEHFLYSLLSTLEIQYRKADI